MRNLKRALSLTLASVMLLGMMVLGTSAAGYPDVDDNDNVEAIEVLQAVGAMSGSNSGNFNPDSPVSRVEMAIVMANLMKLDVNYFAGQNNFSDVPGWASSYVEACAANGIITGVGGGRFGTGNVTATQAALMMLKALGYFQYNEDFNGDWARATAQQAAQIRLFDGLTVSNNTQLTRNQVAQLALNALEADMVRFNGDVGTTIPTANGNVTIGHRTSYESRTSTEPKYNTLRDIGAGDASDIANQGQYYIQLGEELYDGKLTRRGDRDDFDRPATTWRYDYEVIGTYTSDPDLTYTKRVNSGDIYADLGLNNAKTSTEHYEDGKSIGAFTLTRKDTDNKTGRNGQLTQVWYDEWTPKNSSDPGYSLIITHVNTYVGRVNAVNKATSSADRSVTIAQYGNSAIKKPAGGTGTLNLKFETEDFAVQDLVSYTVAENSSTKRFDIQTMEALTPAATGVLTQWKGTQYTDGNDNAGNSNFTVDTVKYDYSYESIVINDNDSEIAISDFDVNTSEVNVYLDKYGYALLVEGVEGEKNYAVVIGVGSTNMFGGGNDGATLLLPDGTTKTVTYKMKKNSPDLTPGNLVDTNYIGDIVKYKVLDDGVYELDLLGAGEQTWDDVPGEVKFTNGKATFTLDDGADSTLTGASDHVFYANSETIFVVATPKTLNAGNPTEMNYDVYTGYQNMPTLLNRTATSDHPADTYYYVAYVTNSYYANQLDIVYIATNTTGGVNSVDTYFVRERDAKMTTETIGGTKVEYYELPAIVSGEETTVRVDASIPTVKANTQRFFAIKNVVKDKNDIITDFVDASSSFTATGAGGKTGVVAVGRNVLGFGGDRNTAEQWVADNRSAAYYVDKDYKTITKLTSVNSVATDDNDLVYASADSETKFLKDVIVIERDPDATYVLTYPAAVEHITGITCNKTNGADLAAGTSVTLNFTVESGYQAQVKVNNSVVSGGPHTGTASVTFSMPAAAAVVTIEVTEAEKETKHYYVGDLGTSTSSKNVQLVIGEWDGEDTNTIRWLSKEEISGLIPDDSKVSVYNKDGIVALAKGPFEQGTIYATQGTGDTQGTQGKITFRDSAIAALNIWQFDGYSADKSGDDSAARIYGQYAGFLKIHLSKALEAGKLMVDLGDVKNVEFYYDPIADLA